MKMMFDGFYERRGEAFVTESRCCHCGAEGACLYVDGSEGEYSPGIFCKECIDKMFASPEPNEELK